MYCKEKGKTYSAYGSSEGLGYGMIITVLMAGHDKNAKSRFNSFLDTYNANPGKTGSGLMSGAIPKRSHYPLSSNAPDGDMDVAYALYMAYKQWGDTKYYYKFKSIVKALMKHNVIKMRFGNIISSEYTTYLINLGDWVNEIKKTDPLYYFKKFGGSRSSDWMLGHLDLFYNRLPDHYKNTKNKCLKTKNHIYKLTRAIQKNYSGDTGLMPDFVEGRGWRHPPFSEKPSFNLRPVCNRGVTNKNGDKVYIESLKDDKYSYNACRFP